MDARLLQYINNYLFGNGDTRSQIVDLERFAELFVYCTRGTVDEKLKVLLQSLGRGDSDSEDVPYILVKEVICSYPSLDFDVEHLIFSMWRALFRPT